MNNYSNYYPSYEEKLVTDGKRLFDLRLNGIEGKTGTIDNAVSKFVLESRTNTFNQLCGEFYLMCDTVINIHTGSIILCDNKTYIVISKIEDFLVYKKALIRETNEVLSFNKNNVSCTLPCIVESQVKLYSMNVKETKYVSELNDSIIIRVANNATSSLLDINDVFTLGRMNYKITNLSDIIEKGLIILKVVITLDNPEIEVPISNIINGVQIIGDETITKGYTKEYKCEFKINGITITDSSIFYLTAEDGENETTLAEIISQKENLNTCIIKAGNTVGLLKLWVKNDTGTIISNPYTIQIKNIF